MYYNRFRYYSPETGTYISTDPLSILGGFNLYSYAYNLNSQIDPFGLIIVYRALNDAQEASAKAGDKDINATHTIQQHVDNGRLQTQYISTTKKPKTAEFYAKYNNSTIIAIDTDKLGSSRAIDISDGIDPQTGKPLRGKAFGYATKDLEVLIEGKIPVDAYKIHKCK